MDRETVKKFLPVLTAYAEGKEVEMLTKVGEWVPATNPGFSYEPDRYRIKPEPKEIWVNEYPNGNSVVYGSEAAAKAGASYRATRVAVHYREVVED